MFSQPLSDSARTNRATLNGILRMVPPFRMLAGKIHGGRSCILKSVAYLINMNGKREALGGSNCV